MGDREGIIIFSRSIFKTSGDMGIFLLKHIPSLVTDDFNNFINVFPVLEEVKKEIFELNRESASCPDGFTSYFFQSY